MTFVIYFPGSTLGPTSDELNCSTPEFLKLAALTAIELAKGAALWLVQFADFAGMISNS
jgi:hypothetical protein